MGGTWQRWGREGRGQKREKREAERGGASQMRGGGCNVLYCT